MNLEERLVEDQAFVRELYEALPVLRPMIDDHAQFFGEVLPHIVFSDITRWADATLRERGSDPGVSLLLDLLETGMTQRGEGVAELVHVAFLENLDTGSPVIPLLGPELRAGLAQIHGTG